MKTLLRVSLWSLLGGILVLSSGCETTQVRELKAENARLTSINMQHAKEAADLNAKLNAISAQRGQDSIEIDGLQKQLKLLRDQLANRPTIRKNILDSRMRAKLMQLAANVGGELVGNRILLPGDFLFGSGSWVLKNNAKSMLRELSAVLGPEQFGLMVVGHTDNDPIKKLRRKGIHSNRHLSLMRALSVVEYMESSDCKYPRGLIYPAGWGELRPVASNSGKSGKAQNRRVEIYIDPDLSNLLTNSAIVDVAPAPAGVSPAPVYGAPTPVPAPAPRYDAVEPEEAAPAKRFPRWEK